MQSFDRMYGALYPDQSLTPTESVAILPRPDRSALSVDPALPATGASPWRAGDRLIARMAGVQVYELPGRLHPPSRRLQGGEVVVFTGEQQAGFSQVLGASDQGWVDTLLLRRP